MIPLTRIHLFSVLIKVRVTILPKFYKINREIYFKYKLNVFVNYYSVNLISFRLLDLFRGKYHEDKHNCKDC